MIITDVRTTLLTGPCANDPFLREVRKLRSAAFIEVFTADGPTNPARGPIIRQEALLRALQEKWIAGAALDTHYHYPMPPDHPLWSFPNVILTPHIFGSSLSPNFKRRIWEIFSGNVERFMCGDPLLNELTGTQLAGR